MRTNLYSLLTILLICLFVLGCNSDPRSNPILKEANASHIEAVNIHNEVVEGMREIASFNLKADNIKDKLNDDKDKLIELDRLRNVSVTLAVDLKRWQAGLVEVPGFEGTHDAHQHSNLAKTMSPEGMLAKQKGSRDSIVFIKTMLTEALVDFKKLAN